MMGQAWHIEVFTEHVMIILIILHMVSCKK